MSRASSSGSLTPTQRESRMNDAPRLVDLTAALAEFEAVAAALEEQPGAEPR